MSRGEGIRFIGRGAPPPVPCALERHDYMYRLANLESAALYKIKTYTVQGLSTKPQEFAALVQIAVAEATLARPGGHASMKAVLVRRGDRNTGPGGHARRLQAVVARQAGRQGCLLDRQAA